MKVKVKKTGNGSIELKISDIRTPFSIVFKANTALRVANEIIALVN